jgi:AcrR family transcriptional regulator
VIIREGLESTTLRDISREGGFTTGVLMHYFPDKQALIAGTFAATSREWIEHARVTLAEAATVPQLLSAFVDFMAELEAADALWEREIHAMLRRVRDEGFLPAGLDLEMEAAVLARLVDGLGLRAWLSGAWDQARSLLIGHLASLGLPLRVVAGLAAEGAGVPV